MKVQEFVNSLKNKDFKAENALNVKKYLPIEVKKEIAKSVIFDCIENNNGIIHVDSVQRYLSYIRNMIIFHTELKYTDEDYDILCSTEYNGTTLLNYVLDLFNEDAQECSRILNLMTDDYMQDYSLDNTISSFVYGLNDKLDNVMSIIKDKINELDTNNIIPSDLDVDQIKKILNI